MKKFLSLLLACLMMVSVLAGCGGNDANTSNEDPADRVLQIRQTSALSSADWQASTLTSDMEITWVQVFEGLYTID